MNKSQQEILDSSELVGDALRKLRMERGLTWRQVAEAANISIEFLGALERNEKTTDKLGIFARLFDIPEESLTALDFRLSTELKHWIKVERSLLRALNQYRQSGKSQADLAKIIHRSI